MNKIQNIIFIFIVLFLLGSYHAVRADFVCGSTVTRGGLTYGSVTGADGKCWLDRNLGALAVSGNGWLFQWGRSDDNHQVTSSGTTTTLSGTNTPGHGLFIKATSSPYDWRSPQYANLWQGTYGINNPCPAGFRIPTQSEWATLISASGITNTATAAASALKIPAAGARAYDTASVYFVGGNGYYWSSTPYSIYAYFVQITGTSVFPANYTNRAQGESVRCIKGITTPVVTTDAVTSITSTTAVGNGTVTDTGGNNPTRYIEWGTTSGSYPNSCNAGIGGMGAYSCSMTGLSVGTTYYVRAKVVNTAGTTYGSETSFVVVVAPTVTTQSTTSITSTGAIGNGTITATGGNNPTRDIEWGTTSGIYTNSCTAGTGSTGPYSCSITSLSPNTTYYVRAKATNSAGTSYGGETSFTTLVALPTVTTQSTSNITISSATGNATITYTGGENPTREIEWGTETNVYTTGSCSASVGGTGTYSCNLTNLQPNTQYFARAKATNSAGTTYGEETQFTTLIDTPDTTTVAPSVITTSSAIGHGTITDTGGENPERFIEWGTVSETYTDSCTAGTGGTGDYACDITNLNPNITYYTRAKATNSAGTSYGSELSFTTLVANPTATTQATTIIQTTTAQGNGTVTATGGENPERFIQYTTTSNDYDTAEECTAGTGSTGQYSCTMTNLTPNTQYFVRAKVTNSSGTTYG
ncbi:MAG: FISUMP domain-containing protein, partial [Parcubacteria group bacterium]